MPELHPPFPFRELEVHVQRTAYALWRAYLSIPPGEAVCLSWLLSIASIFDSSFDNTEETLARSLAWLRESGAIIVMLEALRFIALPPLCHVADKA